MEFEADEIGLLGGRAREAAEIVLAGGEEDVLREQSCTGVEGGEPHVAKRSERFDGDAAMNLAAVFRGAGEKSLIEDAA